MCLWIYQQTLEELEREYSFSWCISPLFLQVVYQCILQIPEGFESELIEDKIAYCLLRLHIHVRSGTAPFFILGRYLSISKFSLANSIISFTRRPLMKRTLMGFHLSRVSTYIKINTGAMSFCYPLRISEM